MKRATIILTVFTLMITSCVDKNNSENQSINQWVYQGLYSYYFWYDKIDDHVIPESEYPEDYFYRLIYDEEDKWSYITNDYQKLEGELKGEPLSMGYSPAFGRINGGNDLFMLIEYVYPDSPAKNAGLKRGNMVTHINGKQLTVDNYIDLYNESKQELTIATVRNNTIYPSDKKLSMTAETLQINPVIFDTVFTLNGTKTGYCVITEYIDETRFIEKVGEALSSLQNQSITELIIDLRYNGGGYINSAQWLASAIAPASVVAGQSVLTRLVYNNKVAAYDDIDDAYYFIDSDVKLNLNKVYFLTGWGTASASELTMIGLMPYMDVTLIGTETYGKYTGSWVIYDLEDPPRHNWAMMPIVMKYANANGLTDFKDGLTPDYYVEEDLFNAPPFGDVSDPLLAQALALTNGMVARKDFSGVKTVGISKNLFKAPDQMIKSNLIIK